MKLWFNLKLWQKVMIGMLLGMATGFFMKEEATIFKPVGIIFINLLKMVVVPLIFFSILNGIASISDASTFGRVGAKALIIYTCTTIFAVIIGLSFANFFQPGIGIQLDIFSQVIPQNAQNKGLGDILLDIIPSNPIKAMAEGHTIQVVVFAFFTGFALILIGEKGQQVKDFVISATHLVFKMIELVIKLTPYGVFAIMACVIGEHGIGLIASLSKFVAVVFAALFMQYLVFGIMLSIVRLSPIPFYRKMLETQSVALATVSSKATLPTAMKELRFKMGVSKQSSSFVLPLGASMNMDGVAIYLGICAVFFAQVLGIELNFQQYLIIILTSTIGSIGAAGFPGGSMVMMGMVLSSVGLPLEGISLILGVDRILEMFRTMINITGDCAVTVLVDKWEGTLNEKVYNNADEENEEGEDY